MGAPHSIRSARDAVADRAAFPFRSARSACRISRCCTRREEDAEYFSALLRESAVLVAERCLELVAFAADRGGCLEHLYVHPLHQRRGIGGALLARVKESNRELRFWVFQRNVAAIAFYERAVFVWCE